MPRRDGTGPMGQGSLTGRGLGNCVGARPYYGAGCGRGFGQGYLQGGRYGRGLGQGMGRHYRRSYQENPTNVKERLLQEKQVLELELAWINQQMVRSDQNKE